MSNVDHFFFEIITQKVTIISFVELMNHAQSRVESNISLNKLLHPQLPRNTLKSDPTCMAMLPFATYKEPPDELFNPYDTGMPTKMN